MIDLVTKLPPTPPEDCDDAYFQAKAAEEAMFTPEQKAQLAADLNSRAVKNRTQAGREFSYIEGWHAIAEANRIFGFDGWSSETLELRLVSEGERANDRGKIFTCTYSARVRITVYAGSRQIIREGIGAGHGMDRDPGNAHEKAAKEAETDATKRAFRTFGNQFGLALYDKEQRNVSATTEGSRGDAHTEEKPGASRVSPPPVTNTVVTDLAKLGTSLRDRERSDTSKRLTEQLIKGPMPQGYDSLDQLSAALETEGGSRTRTKLNKWLGYTKKNRAKLTESDYYRVLNAYMPLDTEIKASFTPVTEAAE